MKRVLIRLALLSVPLLMMLQVLQGYRYAIALEESERLLAKQRDHLEENRRTLAGIAVFDAPTRIYQIAKESLFLVEADPETVLQVRISGSSEILQ